MAAREVLFACTHCHRRCKFEELSSVQQLCKSCRKKYPLVTCTYCRLEFHPIKNAMNKEERPACEHCSRDFKQYGTPNFCTTCNLQSAFNGTKCSRCAHSEKKYGRPVACEHCKLMCAFQKAEDVKKKVDGKTLCLLCTINYKKAQFKRKTHEQKTQTSKHPSKRSDDDKEDEPSASKKIRLETSSSSVGISTSSQLQTLSLLGRDSQPLDFLSSNHLLETNKLQSEIGNLKKQLAQKEQALLEKDKLICTLKAEALDKDKDLKLKLQVQQKSYTETMESLQVEIRSLKRQMQASHKTNTKSSSSTPSAASSVISSLSSTS